VRSGDMLTMHRNNINQDVADGLDFILSMLPNKDFPRNILVGSYHRPFEVWDKDDILYRFKAMSYEDCFLNAYPNYAYLIEKGSLPSTFRPPPNHLMVDIDMKDFVSEQEFQQAIDNVKANIRKYITGVTGENPPIIDSGNGFHIHVPMPGITKSFEERPEFARFTNRIATTATTVVTSTTIKPSELDVKFLRYLENKLTGGRSDRHHNPSINSHMFRIPGTLNTKARDRGKKDPYVRVIEGYKYVNKLIGQEYGLPDFAKERNMSRPTDKLLNDFFLYLMSEKTADRIDQSKRTEKRLRQSLEPNKQFDTDIGIIAWIEKILLTAIADQRKDLLFWVLGPYLVTVKRLDYEQAYEILETWLKKCNEVRELEPGWRDFRRRIKHSLKHCSNKLEQREPWWPISLNTFREQYPDLYGELFGK
jgi:hypothetical protein